MGDERDFPQSQAERCERLLQLFEKMNSDARIAFEKFLIWMSERPKGAEPVSQEDMEKMVEEIRLENIRRRLGGKVGEVLQFKRPE